MQEAVLGHAVQPDACEGLEQAVGMLGSLAHDDRRLPGLLYLSPALAGQAGLALAHARELLPRVEWYGAVAPGVFGIPGGHEADEPALLVALLPIPAGQWEAVMPMQRRRRVGGSALLHASPDLDDLPDRIDALSARFDGQAGGLIAGAERDGTSAQFVAGELFDTACGGLMFDGSVQLRSRLTQGCRSLAAEHVISQCTSHYIQALDGEPALDVLLTDLGLPESVRRSTDGEEILRALPAHELRRGLLVGLSELSGRGRAGFGDYTVRQLVGIDPLHRILAIGAIPRRGDHAIFCTRDRNAAHADLVRICAELRDEAESEGLRILGAHYVSCVSRADLFGSTDAELDILQHNLGDVPIFGFLANGEICDGRIHSHSGVLSLLVADA